LILRKILYLCPLEKKLTNYFNLFDFTYNNTRLKFMSFFLNEINPL
jgi:hypothetical protein